jgi:hypothetical protein
MSFVNPPEFKDSQIISPCEKYDIFYLGLIFIRIFTGIVRIYNFKFKDRAGYGGCIQRN